MDCAYCNYFLRHNDTFLPIGDYSRCDPRHPIANNAETKHGQWQKHYRSGITVSDGFVSSCCDMWNERKTPYCPNCSAKMDGERKDEE